jgi:hypothetical protein
LVISPRCELCGPGRGSGQCEHVGDATFSKSFSLAGLRFGFVLGRRS